MNSANRDDLRSDRARPSRRHVLRLAGVGFGGALAGCLDRPGNGGDGNGTDDVDAIESVETTPFAVRTGRPAWEQAGRIGRTLLVDSDESQRALLDTDVVSESRREAIREFLAEVEYARERVLLVESAGPNACYDRLVIDEVRTQGDEIRANATVIDTSEPETACATVVTFPSTLARIRFEDDPLDAVTVDLTDGWGETAAVSTSVDDPIGFDHRSLDGQIRPEGDPVPIGSLACEEEGVRRQPQGFDESEVVWGDVGRANEPSFALRIGATDYERGDTASIKLTNVADEKRFTGNRAKFNLQAYTDSGWEDVRVGEEDRFFGYTDEAIPHPPGDGFEWTITLSEDGIETASVHDHVRVCPELAPGRYRFAYWGVSDRAVAVAFDLK